MTSRHPDTQHKTTLCFATNNPNKLAEVRSLLHGQYTVASLRDIGCFQALPEEGSTLEENSLQKAAYIAKKYNMTCFSDDTGLEVEQLKNAPGVYSARYAGMQRNDDDNMQLVLEKLSHESNRSARFRTVITLIQEERTYSFEGMVVGTIAMERRGTRGFGYDPIFIPEGRSLSMAEMTLEEKNSISHRRRAIDQLVDHLKKGLA